MPPPGGASAASVPEVLQTETAALDVLVARIFDELPDDKLGDLPEPVWELLTYLVDAGGLQTPVPEAANSN
jgi:hypothetical protein